MTVDQTWSDILTGAVNNFKGNFINGYRLFRTKFDLGNDTLFYEDVSSEETDTAYHIYQISVTYTVIFEGLWALWCHQVGQGLVHSFIDIDLISRHFYLG